jgi:hypothetical protein
VSDVLEDELAAAASDVAASEADAELDSSSLSVRLESLVAALDDELAAAASDVAASDVEPEADSSSLAEIVRSLSAVLEDELVAALSSVAAAVSEEALDDWFSPDALVSVVDSADEAPELASEPSLLDSDEEAADEFSVEPPALSEVFPTLVDCVVDAVPSASAVLDEVELEAVFVPSVLVSCD